MRALFAAVFAASLMAQGQQPAFRSAARVVVLHVTVQNQRGEAVTSLEQRAFSVYENGERQPITLFRRCCR